MEDNTSNQPMVKCSLNGVQIEALIDTGSMKSILHKSVFDKISLHSPPLLIAVAPISVFLLPDSR